MTQLTPTLYAVELCNDATDIELKNNYNVCALQYNAHGNRERDVLTYNGKYELIGTVTPDGIDFDCDFIGTKDAFRGLMYSKGCDLSKKYVIIKSKI